MQPGFAFGASTLRFHFPRDVDECDDDVREHSAVVEEDYEGIEFSPSAGHEQVLDVIKRNAAMAQTASV